MANVPQRKSGKPQTKGKGKGKGKGRKPPRVRTNPNPGRNPQVEGENRDAEIMDDARKDYMSKSNPYTWYANFPNYAKDVATLAFGVPTGQPIYLTSGDYVANAGLMTLYFTPTPGISKNLSSPVNRQAVRIQTYLRSIMRAASDYDAADTMIYLLHNDALYTYWAFLRRAYGVAQLFTPTNKYYPRRLLQAMNIDPDIAHNLADFRAFINKFALNIGRFAMPKDFDLTQRHMWMCSGLYVDSSSTRAQTYMFVPYMLWTMNNTTATGGQLTGYQITSGTSTPASMSLADLQAIADTLIQNIENDSDTMDISGDLYRAYGSTGCFSVEETPDNYAVKPVYDQTVLSQIENSVICGFWTNKTGTSVINPSITQDPSVNGGAIIFDPYVTGGQTDLTNTGIGGNYPLVIGGTPLNMHWDSPTPEQVMEATRLTATASIGASLVRTADMDNYSLGHTSADVINYVTICTTSDTNPNAVRFLFTQTQTVWSNTDGTVLTSNALDLLSIWQQFDWAPMLYNVVYNQTTGTVNLTTMAADVDNMTVASYTQMENIHEAAMLSLLNNMEPVKQ